MIVHLAGVYLSFFIHRGRAVPFPFCMQKMIRTRHDFGRGVFIVLFSGRLGIIPGLAARLPAAFIISGIRFVSIRKSRRIRQGFSLLRCIRQAGGSIRYTISLAAATGSCAAAAHRKNQAQQQRQEQDSFCFHTHSHSLYLSRSRCFQSACRCNSCSVSFNRSNACHRCSSCISWVL